MTPLVKWLLLCIVGIGVAASYIKFQSDKPNASIGEVRELVARQLEKGAIKADKRQAVSIRSDDPPTAFADHSKPRNGLSVKEPADQVVSWTAGLLSVQLKDRPLSWVMDNIARQTGLNIVVASELQSASVTSSFTELELTQGLRQLLSPWDAFFFFSDNQDQGKLRSIWVYPAGKGRAMAPFPPEAQQGNSTQEFELDLMNDDPDIRIKTLETVVARFGDRAIDNITAALKDTDGRVRYRALDVALNAGVTLPTDELLDLAEYDPSPPIRRLALEALAYLAEGPRNPNLDIQKLSERALSDPDPSVSREAERLFPPGRN
ncbi:MAG: hypothetical protein PHO08_15710 [Methylococcales bacterium]|nr:hypothetical protein [Methylococcales bacterium]